MLRLTTTESRILLTLVKDFTTNYNANTLAKKVGITRTGALKILKQFKSKGLLKAKKFGKASFYKLTFEDEYVKKVIETLLLAEAREHAARWLFEFKDIFSNVEIAIIFGSAARDYEKAKDIDLVLVFNQKNLKKVKESIAFKNKILPKRIHAIIQSPSDLKKNLNARDEVLLNALKFGYILHGHQKLIEVIQNVTRF